MRAVRPPIEMATMINETAVIEPETLNVLDGVTMRGAVNVDDDTILKNVRSAIKRPYPQIRPQQPCAERVVLVGGGPSLLDTEDELVALVREGAKLVTVNGAYQWCLERNLFPKTQIVMDARATNARFLDPVIPRCNYVLASQCAPEVWDAVEGRPDVWMFHAAAGSDGPLKTLLDEHYLGQWFGVGGGTTVATRAISLLRTLGYLRFDLFGVDSCFLHGQHHAYAQAENAHDRPIKFSAHPPGRPDLARVFDCTPWHVKQLEDFLQMLRVNGDHFLLNIHGDGLLAYALASSAQLEWTTTED
jgi:hypothetical protein